MSLYYAALNSDGDGFERDQSSPRLPRGVANTMNADAMASFGVFVMRRPSY
jgi:hypothetical protein